MKENPEDCRREGTRGDPYGKAHLQGIIPNVKWEERGEKSGSTEFAQRPGGGGGRLGAIGSLGNLKKRKFPGPSSGGEITLSNRHQSFGTRRQNGWNVTG